MIKAIFAVDQYGGMGMNGSLPWPHNSADLRHFQDLTTGHVVVMGRKTWEDPKMPKPLKQRTVYVASTKPQPHATAISGNLVEKVLAIEKKHPNQTVWIIGGPEILMECRDLYDEVHLTHFKGLYKIDTKIDLKKFLSGFSIRRASVAEDLASTFIKYEPIFKRPTIRSE